MANAFKDVRDLKALLLRDEKTIARNLVCQLLIYATGAPITVSDNAQVDKILMDTEQKRFGARSIVHAIVESDLFQRK